MLGTVNQVKTKALHQQEQYKQVIPDKKLKEVIHKFNSEIEESENQKAVTGKALWQFYHRHII